MNDDNLHRLAVWLTPASIELTAERLEAYRLAVNDLAELPGNADLVEAAHGVVSESERSALAASVIEHDPLFVARDSDELLSRLAGAVVITQLERADSDAVATALLVQSAGFVGLRPSLEELSAVADDLVKTASRNARQRPSPVRVTRKPLAPDADMADAVTLMNSLLKQANNIFSDMHKCLALMDEEINALWWARSEVSTSTGDRWESMNPIDRVITASLELHELISFQPPTAAQLSLLRDVGGDANGMITLSELGKALRSTAVAADEGGQLMPLTSAAHLWNEYQEEPKTVAVLLKKAGFDPKHEVPVRAVGEQLLRERYFSERI